MLDFTINTPPYSIPPHNKRKKIEVKVVSTAVFKQKFVFRGAVYVHAGKPTIYGNVINAIRLKDPTISESEINDLKGKNFLELGDKVHFTKKRGTQWAITEGWQN
jgi:hypothetical protein